MREVLVVVEAATGYRHAWLSVFSADGETFEVVGNPSTGDERIHHRISTLAVKGDRFLTRCMTSEEPFVIEDMRLDPDADPEQVAFFENRTVIMAPMLLLAERIGAFTVGTFGDDEGVRPPTAEELSFFVQIGSLLSVVVGRLRAIDAQRAMEEKMRAHQRLEALGQLAGEVAHDFNNMLVSIIGNSDLLARQIVDPASRELVTEVQEAAHRAATLTRQLLAFSRGQLLDRRDLGLTEVVADLSRMLRRLLPDDVDLVITPSDTDGRVHADRGQLDQVIVNLAINARDAMPDGGRLTIEVTEVDLDSDDVAEHPWARAGRFAVLSVSDTGVGMAPEVRERIFEPFFTTKPAAVGTGLGLAVVGSVLEQHDGFVHVYSEPDVGTTFKLYLPRLDAPVAAGEPAAPAPVVVPASGQGEHVLVVDDDAHILRVVERLLSREGYRVTCAADGALALAALDAHPDVALVLTDLVMPVMSGSALVAAVRDRPDPPRFVVMTGYARGSMADQSFPFTLTKPFGAQELVARVREALAAPNGD